MSPSKAKLTLYGDAEYEIRVDGFLDEHYADWTQEVTIVPSDLSDACPVTTILCTTDQAGLFGILRRLYSLGLPLISVSLVDQ